MAGMVFAAACISMAKADEATPFGAATIGESELQAISGRENVSQFGAIDQTSVVRDNSITGNSVTGTIQFDGQSFQNMNGLGVINANTGNNVSFNASMLVNIVIGSVP